MFPTTQEGIFKHLAEKCFMRLNNKVMTGQDRGVVSLCPLEPWGWSFSLFHGPDGNAFVYCIQVALEKLSYWTSGWETALDCCHMCHQGLPAASSEDKER